MTNLSQNTPESDTKLIRYGDIFKLQWDFVSYDEILWHFGTFVEIQLDLMRYGEFFVRFCEIWSDFAGFDEILWDLVRFGSKYGRQLTILVKIKISKSPD